MSAEPSKRLETFPNPRPGRDYEISMEAPEFTCVCPRTVSLTLQPSESVTYPISFVSNSNL